MKHKRVRLFKMKRINCELCHKPILSKKDFGETVCGPCDMNEAAKHQHSVDKKAKEWAHKHKCRACGKGLELTRYFNCVDCIPIYEDFDDEVIAS